MRVAAGVLFCIIAAINILGGLGWAAGGGLMVGGGEMMEQAAEQAQSQAGDEASAAADVEGSGMLKGMGGAVIFYAIWLLVLAGLEIAAAVMLFKAQKAVFVIVVAALEGVTDAGAIALASSFVFGIVGLIVAIIALIAGVMLHKENQAAAEVA